MYAILRGCKPKGYKSKIDSKKYGTKTNESKENRKTMKNQFVKEYQRELIRGETTRDNIDKALDHMYGVIEKELPI